MGAFDSLKNPLSAALFAMVATILASVVDSKLNEEEVKIFECMKCILFNGFLVGTIVYLITMESSPVKKVNELMTEPF